MSDPVTRLGEARKQIRIVAENVQDDELLGDLHEADALVEGVAGDLEDGPDADGENRYTRKH